MSPLLQTNKLSKEGSIRLKIILFTAFCGTLVLILVLVLWLKKKRSAVEPQLVFANNHLGNAVADAEIGHAEAQAQAQAQGPAEHPGFSLYDEEENTDDSMEPVDLGEELNDEPQDDVYIAQELNVVQGKK